MPISFYFVKYYSLNVRPKLNSPVTSREEPSSSPKRGRWQQLRYDVLNYISPLLFSFEIYRVITLELRCIHKGCNLIALGWSGGRTGKRCGGIYFWNQSFYPTFPEGIFTKDLYGEVPPRGPTPHPFIYHFWEKRYPFRVPSINNAIPFTYL